MKNLKTTLFPSYRFLTVERLSRHTLFGKSITVKPVLRSRKRRTGRALVRVPSYRFLTVERLSRCYNAAKPVLRLNIRLNIASLCAMFLLAFPAQTFSQQSDTSRINFDDLLTMQDTDKPLYIRYGGYAHYDAAAWQRAQFVGFQGMKTCCFDNYGDSLALFGTNFSAGALFEYPIVERFGAALRVGYSRHTAQIRRIQGTTTSYAGVPVGTPLEHRLDITLSTLGVEPLLTFRPIDYLVINVGARLDVALSSAFSYQEISLLDNVAFRKPSGERTSVWNEQSGDIQGRQTLTTSLVAGLSYEAPLNAQGTIFLCPELWYARGLTSLASGMVSRVGGVARDESSWQQDRLRVGFALKISPFRTIRPEITPEMQEKIKILRRTDSLQVLERERNKVQLARMDSVNRVIMAKMDELKKQGISVNLKSVVGVNADGREIPNPTISVDEFRTNHVVMLLPVLYFENGSSVIPSRYRKIQAAARETYRISTLADKTPREIYYEVLNVIGKRMSEPENAGAVLFLSAGGTSSEAPRLLEQRAQAVSDYLQDVWKIPAKRLVMQPSSASSSSGKQAQSIAKNIPRVEFSASQPSICAPLKFDRRTRRASPSMLRFQAEINAGAGLKQWSLEVTQFAGDEVSTLKEEKGTKTPPSTIDWDFGTNEEEIPRSSQDLTVQLTMTDVNNRTADAPLVAVPVVQSSLEQQEASGKGMKRRTRYDVVGFDEFGNPSEANAEALAALRAELPQSSRRSIYISSESLNKNAEAVASVLGINDAVIIVKPFAAAERDTSPLAENKHYRAIVRVELE